MVPVFTQEGRTFIAAFPQAVKQIVGCPVIPAPGFLADVAAKRTHIPDFR
jgi:hypothetical protein